jgi:hypothetical protein
MVILGVSIRVQIVCVSPRELRVFETAELFLKPESCIAFGERHGMGGSLSSSSVKFDQAFICSTSDYLDAGQKNVRWANWRFGPTDISRDLSQARTAAFLSVSFPFSISESLGLPGSSNGAINKS